MKKSEADLVDAMVEERLEANGKIVLDTAQIDQLKQALRNLDEELDRSIG